MTSATALIHQRGTCSGLIAILLWSTTFALARSLAESLGPLTSAAAVYAVAGLFLLPGIYHQWRTGISNRRLTRAYVVGCGSLFVTYSALLYLAVGSCLNRQQILEVALVNYLWPALTVLLSVVILRIPASLWLWPGLLVAITGLFLVLTQGKSFSLEVFRENLLTSPMTYALAAGAALSWAAYSVLTRRWAPKATSGAVGPFILTTAAVLTPFAWSSHEIPQWTVRVGLEVLAQGAITAAAYALWDHAMRHGNLTLVTSASYLTPLLSTAISCYYLGITPSKTLLYGAALLVAGSLLSYLSVSNRPMATAQSSQTG
jgi:drug/metabolite transporter (DMT)-like permease